MGVACPISGVLNFSSCFRIRSHVTDVLGELGCHVTDVVGELGCHVTTVGLSHD